MKSFRASAAAGEWPRVGKLAVGWLKRFGFPRGAVVQPYFTPRFVVSGREALGRRIRGGKLLTAQLVGNLGAICLGLSLSRRAWDFGKFHFGYGDRNMPE